MGFTAAAALGYILFGVLMGGSAVALHYGRSRRRLGRAGGDGSKAVSHMIRAHFHPVGFDQITVSERKFPYRVRADLARALDRLFGEETSITHFCGARKEYAHEGLTLADCMVVTSHNPTISIPPEYEDIDVGDEAPVRCLKVGLWFLEEGTSKYVVLLSPSGQYGQVTGVQFQIATTNTPEGTRIAERFFRHLEEAVLRAESYRGKVLSLDPPEHAYSGESTGITVHRLRSVARDEVILPARTLELLERNVVQFVRKREELSRFRQATKKGILFYGPPGTGKTHTIHYLARALEGHTTLLISGEQVGLLDEYMTLARLLQPSLVVIEDVDLIARNRSDMDGPCEEVLLNKLLNEMDGLKEDADILFVLTTNRPESLEHALASRPGRVDQAIEFPLPDEEGREKLVRLYAGSATLAESLVREVVARTENVSAAFIKELLRRSMQFHLERSDGDPSRDGRLDSDDVASAIDEMLVSGGRLNATLLGATGAAESV